jgi:hypothetical protein
MNTDDRSHPDGRGRLMLNDPIYLAVRSWGLVKT